MKTDHSDLSDVNYCVVSITHIHITWSSLELVAEFLSFSVIYWTQSKRNFFLLSSYWKNLNDMWVKETESEKSIFSCAGKERKKQLNKLAGLMEKCCLLENNYHITKASLSESQKILKQHNHDSEESDRLEMSFREVSVCYFSACFFSSEY
jgi:hypothetical protein